MNEPTSSMLERLQEFLVKNPKDSFVRYGLAMELNKLGRTTEAAGTFLALIGDDPDYVPAYLQAGIVLSRQGQYDEAKRVLREGVQAAGRKGDSHAQGELQGALAEIESG